MIYHADGTADAVLERLVDDRVPVDRPLADGQLTIVDPEGTRAALRRPVRDAAAALAATIDDAVDAGYTGLRVTGQLNYGLLRPGGVSLADHDRIIDTVLAGRPGRVLCFYDRHRFPDDTIERMCALHRVEIEATALYDDGLLRVTRVGRFHHRLAGEVDHSNRPVIARMVAATLDDALRSDDAPRRSSSTCRRCASSTSRAPWGWCTRPRSSPRRTGSRSPACARGCCAPSTAAAPRSPRSSTSPRTSGSPSASAAPPRRAAAARGCRHPPGPPRPGRQRPVRRGLRPPEPRHPERPQPRTARAEPEPHGATEPRATEQWVAPW